MWINWKEFILTNFILQKSFLQYQGKKGYRNILEIKTDLNSMSMTYIVCYVSMTLLALHDAQHQSPNDLSPDDLFIIELFQFLLFLFL